MLLCARAIEGGSRARGEAMAGNGILTLTDDNFDEQIKKVSGPVLVDFWAAWCGPCKMIAPSLEQLAGEMAGRATVAKVNVDENGDVANRFGIRSIPTLMIFKEGRVVDQIVGALPKEQIRRMVEKHLA
jgi:thioredoxin 1